MPAGVLFALGLGLFWWITARSDDAPSSDAASVSAPSFGLPSNNAHARAGLPSIPNDVPSGGASGPPPSSVVTGPVGEERIASLMKTWRDAIVVKNPEPVERLDRLFAERPTEFLAALMVSAETDPEERVRSFSTRVLGKLRQADSLVVLRGLLKDPSVYVRFNAAWALGELTDHQARATLLRLEQRDPSPLVRQSAGDSRRKIEGG
jgi:hypothetical protein